MTALRVHVQRFHPERDAAPSWWSADVEVDPEGSVLDLLGHLKDTVDGSLAWRASCRMGMCGSCGMMIDGRPRLACETFIRDLGAEARIAPLAHLTVERDLMVDTERALAHHASVAPWSMPDPGAASGPLGERLQTPAQQAAFLATAQCIGCMLCLAACPQVALDPGFVGPMALAAGHRASTDSRDAGPGPRASVMQAERGVWGCTLVGSCSAVCPKGVDPAAAIQREKVRGSLAWVRSLAGWRR
jgi:fumarate reductase iron-sulfur subunit